MITASKQHLKRVFLSLGACAVLLDASESTHFEESIPAFKTHLIAYSFQAGAYVSGEYHTSSLLKSIALVDENGTHIRKLGEPYLMNERFIFTAPYTGNYAIALETRENEATVTGTLKKTPLETDPQTPSKTPLLSPTLQKMEGITDTTAFWEMMERRGTPLLEAHEEGDYLLTFLYKGANKSVKIMGAPMGDIAMMEKMEGSDIWYKSFVVPKGTRLSYQLAPDVPHIVGTPREQRVAILSTLQADPYNKTPMAYSKDEDVFHKISTIEVPHQPYTDWSKIKSQRSGQLSTYRFNSHLLNNQREIDVYVPHNFTKEKHYPLLFVFDGKEYQSKVQTPLILDTLIEQKKIPPLIAVFVSNPSAKTRSLELPCNPLLAAFMAKELLPWVKANITPHITAEKTILAGSSYGGLASAYTAFTYPEAFGNVISLSGSFWWKREKEEEPEWLTRTFATTPSKPIAFYLYAGRFETGQNSIDILESNRHLHTVLQAKNRAVFYEEFNGGHDYFSWGVALSDGLIRVFNP